MIWAEAGEEGPTLQFRTPPALSASSEQRGSRAAPQLKVHPLQRQERTPGERSGASRGRTSLPGKGTSGADGGHRIRHLRLSPVPWDVRVSSRSTHFCFVGKSHQEAVWWHRDAPGATWLCDRPGGWAGQGSWTQCRAVSSPWAAGPHQEHVMQTSPGLAKKTEDASRFRKRVFPMGIEAFVNVRVAERVRSGRDGGERPLTFQPEGGESGPQVGPRPGL